MYDMIRDLLCDLNDLYHMFQSELDCIGLTRIPMKSVRIRNWISDPPIMKFIVSGVVQSELSLQCDNSPAFQK